MFHEVLGQDISAEILKKTVQQLKAAPAYLLSGSRGSGKTSLARIFAKALNCQKISPEGEPCNSCSSCCDIQQGMSLQVVEIDGASHRGIDDIRSLIETCQYAPDDGGYRVYIIDEVHMLTKEAFNALLKTLEEPPRKVVFVLATTDLQKVPPTIASRCLQLCLKRISNEIIAKKLVKLIEADGVHTYESAVPFLIAKRAEGSLRDAESLLEQLLAFSEHHLSVDQISSVLGIPNDTLLLDFDEAFLNENIQDLLSIGEKLFHQSQDGYVLLRDMARHYQNHLFFLYFQDFSLIQSLSKDEATRFTKLNARFNKKLLSQILTKIKEAIPILDFSPQIIFRALFLEISQTKNSVELFEIFQILQKLEAVEETGSRLPEEKVADTVETDTIEAGYSGNERRKNAKLENIIHFLAKETNAMLSTKIR